MALLAAFTVGSEFRRPLENLFRVGRTVTAEVPVSFHCRCKSNKWLNVNSFSLSQSKIFFSNSVQFPREICRIGDLFVILKGKQGYENLRLHPLFRLRKPVPAVRHVAVGSFRPEYCRLRRRRAAPVRRRRPAAAHTRRAGTFRKDVYKRQRPSYKPLRDSCRAIRSICRDVYKRQPPTWGRSGSKTASR